MDNFIRRIINGNKLKGNKTKGNFWMIKVNKS
jgi:hypothetical protein